MTFHRNAKLVLPGRFALVQAIEGGMSVRAAAGAFRLAGDRFPLVGAAGATQARRPRGTLVCLCDRSSRPHRSPRRLAHELQEGSAPAAARRAGDRAWSRTRPASLTQPSGRPCAERGSRDRRRAVRQAANRYERPCPGDLLLHMDVSPMRDRSQRSRNWMRAETRVGSDFAHALVDDRSRLAYVELYPGRASGDGDQLR